MKRRINTLLALLFIISTLTSSLHELLPHHNGSDCQICTLIQHDNALVPGKTAGLPPVATLFEPILLPRKEIRHSPITASNPRAPPHFS